MLSAPDSNVVLCVKGHYNYDNYNTRHERTVAVVPDSTKVMHFKKAFSSGGNFPTKVMRNGDGNKKRKMELAAKLSVVHRLIYYNHSSNSNLSNTKSTLISRQSSSTISTGLFFGFFPYSSSKNSKLKSFLQKCQITSEQNFGLV